MKFKFDVNFTSLPRCSKVIIYDIYSLSFWSKGYRWVLFWMCYPIFVFYRTSDFEVHSDLLLATLTTPNMTSMLSGSGSDSQQDSPDDDGASTGSADQEEWETVPTSLPLPPQGPGRVSEEGNSPSPPEPSPSMMSASNLPQAPGGLVSSAVASVASLWRTATSQLEKRWWR